MDNPFDVANQLIQLTLLNRTQFAMFIKVELNF